MVDRKYFILLKSGNSVTQLGGNMVCTAKVDGREAMEAVWQNYPSLIYRRKIMTLST